jgi:polysaccharide biosynthesis transport protein
VEKTERTLAEYLTTLHRRKGSLLSAMTVILLITISLAFGLPPVYRASATILIEQQEIPQDLVRSVITSYADERIQLISQRVMTTANLRAIIEKYTLYPEMQTNEPIEAVIKELRDDVHLETVNAEVRDPRSGRAQEATIAFTLSYESQSPKLARNVANELVSLYLNENLKNRTEAAVETSQFLAEEAQKLAVKVSELEKKLADFKEHNAGKLPELIQLNLQLLNQTENELREAERQIRSFEEREVYLRGQLALLSPYNTLYTETGQRILGPADRLKVLQTEYLGLASRYAQNHPDIVRLRKEIEALKLETGPGDLRGEIETQLKGLQAELATARKRYSKDHPDVKRLIRTVTGLEEDLRKASVLKPAPTALMDADNLAYIQLKAQLEVSTTELATLRAKKQELKTKYAAYNTLLAQTPQVEREYLALTRDYESAVAKYKEVTAKQMEAQLAHSLEAEHKGERFTLIEPPMLPEKPAKPNRLAILFLGIVFSFAGGVGTAALGENMDTTVRGSRGIIELLGASPLGMIPHIGTPDEARRKVVNKGIIIILSMTGLLAALFLVHSLVIPLDVLWFGGLRHLGI